jgi:hypothetical protein
MAIHTVPLPHHSRKAPPILSAQSWALYVGDRLHVGPGVAKVEILAKWFYASNCQEL